MREFKGAQRAELWRRRRGGSGRLQSGPRYLRQRVLAGSCLLMARMRRTDATNLLLGRQENHSTDEQLCAPQAAAAHSSGCHSWIPVCLPGIPEMEDISVAGNSRLSHINSLMANRSSAHSAAFPTGTALAGSVPSPHFPLLRIPWHC